MSLADQITNHEPWSPDALCGISGTGEEFNAVRDELIEGRKLRTAAEALKRVEVSIGQEGHDTWLELDGPGWADATDAPTTLAELVGRADEHAEDCR